MTIGGPGADGDGPRNRAMVSGDARAKVLVQEVDPDPIRMAAKAVELWKAGLWENLIPE